MFWGLCPGWIDMIKSHHGADYDELEMLWFRETASELIHTYEDLRAGRVLHVTAPYLDYLRP